MKKFLFVFGLVCFVGFGCQGGVEDESEVVEMTEKDVNERVEEEKVVEEVAEDVKVVQNGESEIIMVKYDGAFFSVHYPDSFNIHNADNDYVAFAAPEGDVIFEVYSPQWFGDPAIIMPREGENLVSEKEENSVLNTSELGPDANLKVIWMTLEAEDGSYIRSIVDHQLSDSGGATKTRKTFAIQYPSKEGYDKYYDYYLIFKDSLEQFAD